MGMTITLNNTGKISEAFFRRLKRNRRYLSPMKEKRVIRLRMRRALSASVFFKRRQVPALRTWNTAGEFQTELTLNLSKNQGMPSFKARGFHRTGRVQILQQRKITGAGSSGNQRGAQFNGTVHALQFANYENIRNLTRRENAGFVPFIMIRPMRRNC